MNETELSRYIFTQLQRGLTPDDITVQLRNASWNEADIANGFTIAQARLAPSPIVDTPAASDPSTPNTQTEPVAVQLPAPIQRTRLKTGWLLFKQSLRVIKDNPGLSRYMIMSMLFSFGIIAVLAAVVIVDMMNAQVLFVEGIDTSGDTTIYPTLAGFFVLLVVGYLTTFITYYYATALSSHVLSLFRGTPGSYAQHIAHARKRLSAIAVYALIATLVGTILRAIEERSKFVGLLVSRLLGALWTVATSFVLPIIADSDESGTKAIKHSVGLFKATWGETITSRVALSGLLFIIYFLVAIPLGVILSIILIGVFGIVGIFPVIALFFIGIVVISILDVLASNILNVSLYYYAQYKVIPPAFSPELLASVFINKKRKK